MKEDYSRAIMDLENLRSKPVRAPFGYYGAKQRIARQIVGELPPHNAWVEAFCGSAALTLAKKPAPIEIINDRDGEIVNFFEQLRNNSEALCRAVALTPYARAEFEMARSGTTYNIPLERARRFLVSTMMTVNASIGEKGSGFSFSQSYTRDGKEARVSRWYNLPKRLENVVDRLRRIRIENRDARELVQMFSDRPATLIYLDPPYYVKRDHGYLIDAKDRNFHVELLQLCAKAKCMILISGYENDLYNEILNTDKGWTTSRFYTHTRDTRGREYARIEVVWKNKQCTKALTTGRVPIRLTMKEKTENKINPPRK